MLNTEVLLWGAEEAGASALDRVFETSDLPKQISELGLFSLVTV